MSDIVKRLRSIAKLAEQAIYDIDPPLSDAADEIERLRAILEDFVAWHNVGGGGRPIGKILEEGRRALERKE